MASLSLAPRQSNPSGFFDNPGAGARKSWALETTQNITYSTVFSSYTIALWQQKSGGGGAELGPIVLLKQDFSPPQNSFLWTVQTYNLDLAKSNVFFFWIFNGTDPAAQGVTPAPSVSSAYFTILEKDAASTTTKPADSTTTTASRSPTATYKATGTPATTAPGVSAETAAAGAGGGGGGGGVNAVAVGVGAGLGVLILVGLIALAAWLWKKTTVLDRWKRSPKGTGTAAEMEAAQTQEANMPVKTWTPSYNELGEANQAAELSVGSAAPGMGHSGRRTELP